MKCMQALNTKVNKNSPEFKANYEGMQGLLNELDAKLEESRFQGKEKHIQKAREKDKLLARERIELLLDEDSPFLELLPLAGLGGKGFGPGGTTVGGIGIVKGKLCMVVSNVGTNKGGAVDYATLMKSLPNFVGKCR